MSVDWRRKMTAPNSGLLMCLVGSSRREKLFPPPAAPPRMAMSAGVARKASCGPFCGLIPLIAAIVRQVDVHLTGEVEGYAAGLLVLQDADVFGQAVERALLIGEFDLV